MAGVPGKMVPGVGCCWQSGCEVEADELGWPGGGGRILPGRHCGSGGAAVGVEEPLVQGLRREVEILASLSLGWSRNYEPS
jgi:hypothetical protein